MRTYQLPHGVYRYTIAGPIVCAVCCIVGTALVELGLLSSVRHRVEKRETRAAARGQHTHAFAYILEEVTSTRVRTVLHININCACYGCVLQKT